jgi:hypothetical protein
MVRQLVSLAEIVEACNRLEYKKNTKIKHLFD